MLKKFVSANNLVIVVSLIFFSMSLSELCTEYGCYHIYVSLQLCVQNAVSIQPCVGKLGISLVLLNFLGCNFRLWFETP